MTPGRWEVLWKKRSGAGSLGAQECGPRSGSQRRPPPGGDLWAKIWQRGGHESGGFLRKTFQAKASPCEGLKGMCLAHVSRAKETAAWAFVCVYTHSRVRKHTQECIGTECSRRRKARQKGKELGGNWFPGPERPAFKQWSHLTSFLFTFYSPATWLNTSNNPKSINTNGFRAHAYKDDRKLK